MESDMTVGDLIEELQKLDSRISVVILDRDNFNVFFGGRFNVALVSDDGDDFAVIDVGGCNICDDDV